MSANLLQGLSIFLVGMMGTGKTTVGKSLAKKLGYRFFDTDESIERVANQTVREIFEEYGESDFRELETKVLAELSTLTRSAIATGGGIVLKPMNWSYLHQGLIIWLDAPVPLIVERLREDTTRPLLDTPNLTDTLTELLESRRNLYAQADLRLEIEADRTPDAIADTIIKRIPTVLKSKPIPPSKS
ncbi:shikimate kinase [Lusitaniella coriacea]|nr:shikimate kinase [Lusitaniella coriacea]